MLSVTISHLFFLQRISWVCLFLFIIINVVYGFLFFCSSKIFLNAVSLPPIHLTYHNSQANLFKALLLSFYLLAQAFPMVPPISSNMKFFSVTAEALLGQALPCTCTFSLFPNTKPSSDQTSDFSRHYMSLYCISLVPLLWHGCAVALIWSLLYILLMFLTKYVCEEMTFWRTAKN